MAGNIAEHFKKISSRFMFEMGLEWFHDQIMEGVRKWLGQYSPEDIRRMVRQRQFPSVPTHYFEQVSGWSQYLEKISVIRLMEMIAEARPELAAAIEEMGMEGAEYMVLLREQFLAWAKDPSQAPVVGEKVDMVKAVCDACGQSWPVKRADFEKIEKCPFCGHSVNEPGPAT